MKEIQSDLQWHFYAFDIDDNIFHMPTHIHIEKNVSGTWEKLDISSSNFAKIRTTNLWKPQKDDKFAFSEFTDCGPRKGNAFKEDMITAIKTGCYGPSWDAFIKCLCEGAIFSFITARGHEPPTFKKAVCYIIDNILTKQEKELMYFNCYTNIKYIINDKVIKFKQNISNNKKISSTPLINFYLNMCDFYGVTSASFIKKFGVVDFKTTEIAKKKALEKFINKCNDIGYKTNAISVSIGFSDDDINNVNYIKLYFKEKAFISLDLKHKLKLNVFNTENPDIKGGICFKY